MQFPRPLPFLFGSFQKKAATLLVVHEPRQAAKYVTSPPRKPSKELLCLPGTNDTLSWMYFPGVTSVNAACDMVRNEKTLTQIYFAEGVTQAQAEPILLACLPKISFAHDAKARVFRLTGPGAQ
jgi:hypothetical protein